MKCTIDIPFTKEVEVRKIETISGVVNVEGTYLPISIGDYSRLYQVFRARDVNYYDFSSYAHETLKQQPDELPTKSITGFAHYFENYLANYAQDILGDSTFILRDLTY